MIASEVKTALDYLFSGADPASARALDRATRITNLRVGLRLGRRDVAAARFDGFVSCDECGRDIAEHVDDGAPEGVCGIRFDEREIGDLREAYGLTREPS